MAMKFEQLQNYAPQLFSIAKKHGITKIYVFGSVVREDSTPQSDVDFLVEMDAGASLLGIPDFSYEAEQLLGVPVDVIPASVLPQVDDREFVSNIQKEAIPL
jgi:predicted nucleotidyltransferase